MQQRHRLIINVLSNYGTLMLYTITQFILIGYAVRKLGSDAFGLLTLVMSITIIAELLGRGVSQALTKHLSAAIGKEQNIRANEFINTSIAWFLFYALLGGTICGALANHIDRFFDIPSHLISEARWAMWFMAIRVVVCFPFNTFQGILFAYQRHDLANLSKSITVIFRFLTIIAFFEFVSPGIIAFIVITIISLVAERLLWLLFSMSIAENMRFKFSLVSRWAMVALFGFGSFITLICVANMVGYVAIKWVIALELTVMDVGGYSLIAALALTASSLARSISNVLMPVASKYNALQQHDTNVQLALLATKYAMIISSLLCLMPLLLIKPLLTLWVGNNYTPEYISQLARAGMVLLVGEWTITTAVCILQILNGVGKVRVPTAVTISWAFGGLGAVWAYLHWVQNSMFAAVVGISIARVIGTVLHMFYGLNTLKIPPGRMLLGSILRPASAGIVVCAISYFLLSYFNVYKPTFFILVIIMLTIMYALLVWTVVLSRSERADLISNIRSSLLCRKSHGIHNKNVKPRALRACNPDKYS